MRMLPVVLALLACLSCSSFRIKSAAAPTEALLEAGFRYLISEHPPDSIGEWIGGPAEVICLGVGESDPDPRLLARFADLPQQAVPGSECRPHPTDHRANARLVHLRSGRPTILYVVYQPEVLSESEGKLDVLYLVAGLYGAEYECSVQKQEVVWQVKSCTRTADI